MQPQSTALTLHTTPTTCFLTACALTACSLTIFCLTTCSLTAFSWQPAVWQSYLSACSLPLSVFWLPVSADWQVTACDRLSALRLPVFTGCPNPLRACSSCLVPAVCASGCWLSSLRFVWVASLLWLLPDPSSLSLMLSHSSSSPLFLLSLSTISAQSFFLTSWLCFEWSHQYCICFGLKMSRLFASAWPHMDRRLKQRLRRWSQQQTCALSVPLSSS